MKEKTNSKYALKKEHMKNGTYHGTSPFYTNIAEYQFDNRPLGNYSHIQELMKKTTFRIP